MIKYDKILGAVRENDAGAVALPIQEEGSTVTAAPTAINFVGAGATVTDVAGVATVTISGGGGSSLSPSYHLTDVASATTTYSGINTNSSTTNANWAIVKKVLSGNNRETVTISTATDQWVNRVTASYTTSLTYSN